MNRRTIEMLAVLAVYLLAILFLIIAFATNNWVSLTVDGIDGSSGLFKVCVQSVCIDIDDHYSRSWELFYYSK